MNAIKDVETVADALSGLIAVVEETALESLARLADYIAELEAELSKTHWEVFDCEKRLRP